MLTDHDIQEPPDTAPTADVGAPQPTPNTATATVGPSPAPDETSVREQEGLPPDTIILAPAFTATPMRCPDDVWAILVSALDIV